MNGWLYAFLKLAVLPPGLVLVPGIVGLVLLLRWRRLGLILIVGSLVTLWLLSMPWTAAQLSRDLEYRYPHVEPAVLETLGAQAILVLGGGAYQAGPEFNGYEEVARLTLERLRYAARLHRVTELPLAVTGGTPKGRPTPEGLSMRTTLVADFGVPVRWAEMNSINTAENAEFSRALMPYETIALVTHAVHMPRAVRFFEDAGFNVVPAPMGYFSREQDGPSSLIDFLPEMKALNGSHYAIYERIGMIWYDCCYDSD